MKEDARSLPAVVQEEKRKQAIRMWKTNRYIHKDIGEQVGVHSLTVGRWVRTYQAEGIKALKACEQQGRPVGSGRLLSPEQEKSIQRLLIDKTPDQLKLRYAPWTREAVQQLIWQETGVKVAIRTIGTYLKRWGFTVQKPKKQAYEQRPSEVRTWLDEQYPAIHARAKAEHVEIYWGDETGLCSDSQHVRGYAPKGKTPILRLNAKRASINLISAITNQGKIRFRLFDGTMKADILIDFMQRLVKDARCKVFLILDNLRVHHAKLVKAWLAEHKDEIEVFYLPSYSPELNPDEYMNMNGDLKAGVHGGIPAHSKSELKAKAIAHLRKLQKLPCRVMKYFQAEPIRYAAYA